MTDILKCFSEPSVGGAIAFGVGLLWGSFFNVCILRLPFDQSIVFEGSRCPHCLTPLHWYQNIPIISFLWLRGKCGHCAAPISIQYPIIELLTGCLFLIMFLQYGPSLRFILYTTFASALLVTTVIDLYHQIIPDEISLSGIVTGFCVSLIINDISWIESVTGILLGGGSFFLIATLYEKISGREGLGGGDVKLLAMIGAWLGYKSIIPVIIISSTVGSLVGIVIMLSQRKDLKTAIPFGPFLALGAMAYLFWSQQILSLLFPFASR